MKPSLRGVSDARREKKREERVSLAFFFPSGEELSFIRSRVKGVGVSSSTTRLIHKELIECLLFRNK